MDEETVVAVTIGVDEGGTVKGADAGGMTTGKSGRPT
jgi:hypothetical protein